MKLLAADSKYPVCVGGGRYLKFRDLILSDTLIQSVWSIWNGLFMLNIVYRMVQDSQKYILWAISVPSV